MCSQDQADQTPKVVLAAMGQHEQRQPEQHQAPQRQPHQRLGPRPSLESGQLAGGQMPAVWTITAKPLQTKTPAISWDRSRVAVVVLTVLGCMVQCASYSVPQPFYPQVAKMKGNDVTQIGIVFSTFPFIGFLSSPLIGKMLSAGVTPKSMLIAGLAIDGFFLSLMGWLDVIESSMGFFVATMMTRLLEAVGFSICLTCYNTLIASQFPDHLQIMVPLVETVFGFGIMTGPAAGGVLYDVGGYRLPFLTFGGCSLLFACVAMIALPSNLNPAKSSPQCFDDMYRQKSIEGANDLAVITSVSKPPPSPLPASEKQDQPSDKLWIKKLLSDWRVLCDVIAVVVCCFVSGFNGATLALRTTQLGVSMASQRSLVFLTYGIVYAISSLANGILSNFIEDCRLLVLAGGVIFSTGLVLLGPLPILPIEPSWYILMLSQVLMGIGNGAIYNLSYVHTLKYVINRLKYPPQESTYALVACLFSTGFFLGAFLGPILGGVLFDLIGYQYATTVVLLVVVISMAPMYPLVIRDRVRRVLQSTPFDLRI